MTIKIILLLICLLLSAFFSGTEIVYAKVNKVKLEREAENGDKKSKKAIDIIHNYPRTISTILIGNNLVNIATSSIAMLVALDIAQGRISENLVTVYATITVTVVVLIFGEILPKTIFPNFSYTLARNFSSIINFFTFIFYPITWVVTKFVDQLAKLWTKKKDESEEDTVDDELLNMTEELENNGSIDCDDAELIKSAIEFCDTTAWQIMVPRVDVVAYDIDDGLDSMIKDPKFFENSRVPLYKDTIDHIVGLIDTTLVMKKLLTKEKIDIQDCLYEPLYVHKTMAVSLILKELKHSHKHLAVVIDEWGGVMGILTIEDILEELFGDIWDETDVVEPEYTEIEENRYLVDGDMSIYDFFDLVDYDDRDFESEYTTVGGWCTEILEKFPEVGDAFQFENLTLSIIEVTEHRVEKVEVYVAPLDEEETA